MGEEYKIFKAQEGKATRWDEKQENKEKNQDIRNKFQKDRDRILYSRAFRRLSGKTQVFRSGNDDHIRTRLTHTLEVSQIARTISKALGLDEDLTEAIALGHDLGHTPFGHVGERTLNHIMNGCYLISDFNKNIDDHEKGFKHNLQGARVVNELEENSLNLTKETIWGIINHSSLKYKDCYKNGTINCDVKYENNNKYCNKELKLDFYNYILEKIEDSKYWTLEAYVVAIADEIAQRHHDIEDAIEFKILSSESLAKEIKNSFKCCERYNYYEDKIDKLKRGKDKHEIISNFSKFIVDFLVTDVINQSKKNLENMKDKFNIDNEEEFYSKKDEIFKTLKDNKSYTKSIIEFSEEVKSGDKKLQDFLKNRILKSYEAQRMDGLGSYVIIKLFEAYIYNPQQLKDKTIKKLYEKIYDKKTEFLKFITNSSTDDLENYIEKSNSEELKKSIDLIKNIKPANKCDNGTYREVISKLHHEVIDSNTNIERIYKQLLLRTICDYISGMTDNYAINEHKELYNKN